jgi:hypothetical protein
MTSPLLKDLQDIVEKTLNKKGVKGTLPLGCLPLWGREGVTLLFVTKITE